MRGRTLKTIVAGAAVTAVLGTGVAVAADATSCPYGNQPKAGAVARGDQTRDRSREQARRHLRLRERDGTGPHHGAAGAAQQRNRGRDCPQRS